MLFVAFFKAKPEPSDEDLADKSRRWWNEGGRPEGLRTLSAFRTVGSDAPNFFVFEADDVEDLDTMVKYWQDMSFEIHPAVDLLDEFRSQGMNIA